jgi:hypothetical protein
MANAASVSRFLGELMNTRSMTYTTRVKGWNHFTAGYQVTRYNDKGIVKVEHTMGDGRSTMAFPERRAGVAAKIEEYRKELSERYDVEVCNADNPSGVPYLLVRSY